ncbi:hypothetical protein E0Z10_g9159 [Xylaria hypoxylon]|uniref:Helicase C-terminal domain-containing protein n=1 Tax=Xylaria hypoxylon TaxID=37992 RepID=A0A4Z0YK48_9PEZI|nr:hypothetical protein E0Z10_g9159 [Xylaria hypoxylon]
MLDKVGQVLLAQGFNYRRIDGQSSLKSRAEAIRVFSEDNNCTVMLASIGSAGEGVDFTAAQYVHILEPHWNPMVEAQAVDRVHRIGQTLPVTITRYIVPRSIESYIQWVQSDKLRLINMSLDTIEDAAKIEQNRWKHSSGRDLKVIEHCCIVWFPKDGTPEDDYPVVYLDPTVYSGVPAQCTPPCRLVFPPSSLSEPTTISIPKYTTSLQVKPGTTTTITITVSQITVTTMSYSNVVVSSSQSSKTITPYESVDLPDITTTIGDQTRTLHLPPWPRITLGPPDQWTSSGNSTTNPGWTFPTTPSRPTPVSIPPITKPEYTGPEPDPNDPTRWPTNLDPTPVPTPVPDEGEDDDDDPDDNHWKSSCKLWFFSICISWPGPFDVDING